MAQQGTIQPVAGYRADRADRLEGKCLRRRFFPDDGLRAVYKREVKAGRCGVLWQ